MKIVHVISSIAEAAGTSVFVCELAREQIAAGHEVAILLKQRNAHEYPAADGIAVGCDCRNIPPADIAHIHGLWDPWLDYKVDAWHGKRVPIVWSPHGMLSPWSMRHKWWKKIPYWFLLERKKFGKASLVHVMSVQEKDWVCKYGERRKVVVAPLGVRLPEQVRRPLQGMSRRRTLLFVGRIYPVKGLDLLIAAFDRLKDCNWQLRIVGPDQAHYMRKLLKTALAMGWKTQVSRNDGVPFELSKGFKSISFAGPRYEAQLVAEYEHADAFVLPSYTENFGSVVVEALAYALPVLTSTATPWQILKERGCGLEFDLNVEAEHGALARMIGFSDAERREMGMRGRKLAEEKYQWSAIGRQMLAAYEGLLRDKN